MKSIIHINRQVMNNNRKTGKRDPVITCKDYKNNRYGKRVDILDSRGKVVASIIQADDKPLKCGARCYISTSNKVIVR